MADQEYIHIDHNQTYEHVVSKDPYIWDYLHMNKHETEIMVTTVTLTYNPDTFSWCECIPLVTCLSADTRHEQQHPKWAIAA